MGKDRIHNYDLSLRWIGNTGSGTSSYSAYSRNHEVNAAGIPSSLLLSSDPGFRGDTSRYSPEQLLVASLSSCHMLWTLHLCSDAGIVVTAYEDSPTGVMQEHEDGSGEFSMVTLKPALTITDPFREGELAGIHHRAHEMCFIARSVRFPVNVEPQTVDIRRQAVNSL